MQITREQFKNILNGIVMEIRRNNESNTIN